MAQYGIGQSVPREEDPRLLRGNGRYVDDIRTANEARGVVVRSPHAHAKISAIDVRRAKQMPGVLAVLTGDDLKARGLGAQRPHIPRKRSGGAPAYVTPQPILAQGRARYVGEPVVFVVADTLDQAKDAAELVDITYEALPVVVDAEAALAQGAPAVWDDNPGNEAFLHEAGNKAGVDEAFAKAAHRVRHKIVINRVTANAMEPRGCVASYDAEDDRYAIRCTIQSAHGTRAVLAGIFKSPHNRFRVVCDNMGGGFGMKGGCSPEWREIDLVAAWSVDRLGRSLQDLVTFLGELHGKGCDLYLHQQGLDTSTPSGKAMFQMMGVFAEFERAMIVERVKAGLSRARAQGKTLGRPTLSADKERVVRRLLAKGTGIVKTAGLAGVGVSAVQRIKAAAAT